MAKHSKVKIIKVPLSPRTKYKYPLKKSFPPLPELYCQLLENKDRVDPNLVNKPYKASFLTDPDYEMKRKQFMEKTSRQDFSIPEESDIELDVEEGEEEYNSDYSSMSEISFNDFNGDAESATFSAASSPELSKNMEKFFVDDNEKIKMSQPKSWTSSTYKRTIPTLDDLSKMGKFKAQTDKDEESIAESDAPEESNENQRRQLLFKFELLKKSYKHAREKIPNYSIHTPISTLKQGYKDTLQHLKVDESVDKYRKILIIGFMVVEWFFGRFLKFEMEGFARLQIINMHNYDNLLYELGEKSYDPTKKSWPVEVRLIFAILINAAGFILSKLLVGGNFNNIMNFMGGFLNVNASVSETSPKKPSRKMRGPVNFDDIPDV